MKILYHHRTRSQDGQRIHIDGLVGALRRAGHEVREVGPAAPATEDHRQGRSVPAWLRPGRELLEIAYNLREILQLLRAARAVQPEALYSRHALFCCAPRVVARLLALPWIVEVNAPLSLERSRHGGLFFRRLARFLETRTLNAADRVVVVTGVMQRLLEQQGVRRERLEVHFNGIDPARRTPARDPAAVRRDLGLEGRLVLGFVGFVRDWNRLDRTYPFLKEHPGAVLLVVGDGPDRGRLEQEAARLGVGAQVRFAGAVDAARVPEHVATFDVALLPETPEYASPLKLLDYLALGRAILAPDRENLREVLEDQKNALLFRGEDDAGFLAGLEMLSSSGELRARLGREARDTIDRLGLTWDRHAARVVETLRELGPPRRAAEAVS